MKAETIVGDPKNNKYKLPEAECNRCGKKIGKEAGLTCRDCQKDEAMGFPMSFSIID